MPNILTKALSTWTSSVAPCKKCTISSLCKHKVTHKLYPNPRRVSVDLLFIGEAPGDSEYINKEPFIGPAGSELHKILEEAVPPHVPYLITNSILCTPFTSSNRDTIRPPSLSEIEECSSHLIRLVKITRPKGLIALGVVAERSIKRIIPYHPLPYIHVTHPSKIMQSAKYRYEFDNAVLKIKTFQSQILNLSL